MAASTSAMPNTMENVKKSLEIAINDITSQLEGWIHTKKRNYSLQSGAFETMDGYIGYISCFRHQNPGEDSIDTVIQLVRKADTVEVTVEINWSNGKPIRDIGQTSIPLSAEEERQVGAFFDRITPLVIHSLTSLMAD